MKILVLIKQTPETDAKITPTSGGDAIDTSSLKFIVNPYDEYAIEEALKIKQDAGSGEVIVVTLGPDSVKERLLKPLAMGADRGILINDDGLKNADSFVISQVLSKAIEQEAPDLVLCGQQGIDGNDMHIPPMVAENLNWPHVNVVCQLKVDGKQLELHREVDSGQTEVYQVQLPAVVGASKALNSPRYASVPGIMKARKKPLDRKTVEDLGLNVADLKGQTQAVIKTYMSPPEKPEGRLFQGEDTASMVSQVVQLLRDEAKVL
ncbi:MAG: electron transfer flavoprotein subunit beta [Oligoflexales bacterium]